jgi:hypothetical protein
VAEALFVRRWDAVGRIGSKFYLPGGASETGGGLQSTASLAADN